MYLTQISLALDTIGPLVGLIAMGALALALRHLVFSYTRPHDQIKPSDGAFTYLLVFVGLAIVALGVTSELSRIASTAEPAESVIPHPTTVKPSTAPARETTPDSSRVEVPNVVGLTAEVAKLKLVDRGLGVSFINAEGETISDITDLTVLTQYRTPGVFVEPQTVITLELGLDETLQDDDGIGNQDLIEIDPFADSTWDLEDAPLTSAAGFGVWSEPEGWYTDFIFMIDTPPNITHLVGDNIVESKVNVRRIAGYDDLLPTEDIVVFFRPGVPVMDESGNFLYYENYGRTRLKCRKKQLAMNEETTCIASFHESNHSWIMNSYWRFNRTDVAAWPRQTTKASTKA